MAATKRLTAAAAGGCDRDAQRQQHVVTTGSVPARTNGSSFSGSQLVWGVLPRQGLQLQVLRHVRQGQRHVHGRPVAVPPPRWSRLLSQMIPLASRRGGGTTWSTTFTFVRRTPPWTSAMSQRPDSKRCRARIWRDENPYYLQVAASAMAVFGKPPPVGVTVPATLGVRFLQYTFCASLLIINADLQTLDRSLLLRAGQWQPDRADAVRAGQRRGDGGPPELQQPARGRCIRRASRTT